jgi:hypothetical protein
VNSDRSCTGVYEVAINIDLRPGPGKGRPTIFGLVVLILDDAVRRDDWNRTSGLVVPDHALSLLSYIPK